MKRYAYLIILLLLSVSAAWTAEQSNWSARKNHQISEVSEKAFSLAKSYYLANAKEGGENIDYIYSVYPFNGFLVVSITPQHKGENGEYLVVPDGDVCVYIDSAFNIKAMRQCLAPITDLIK